MGLNVEMQGVAVEATVTLTNAAVSGAAEAVRTVSSGRKFKLTDIVISNAGTSKLGITLVDTGTTSTTSKYPIIYVPPKDTVTISPTVGPEFTTGVYAFADSAPSTNIKISVAGIEL